MFLRPSNLLIILPSLILGVSSHTPRMGTREYAVDPEDPMRIRQLVNPTRCLNAASWSDSLGKLIITDCPDVTEKWYSFKPYNRSLTVEHEGTEFALEALEGSEVGMVLPDYNSREQRWLVQQDDRISVDSDPKRCLTVYRDSASGAESVDARECGEGPDDPQGEIQQTWYLDYDL